MSMRTLLWKELTEQWRSYRLLIVAAVLVATGILGPLSARYLNELMLAIPGAPPGLESVLPKPDAALAVEQLVKNLAQFGVILALLVPMATVVGEKASGTAAITLSKPVSRAAFLAAKFGALKVMLVTGIGLGVLAGYAYIGMLFEWLPGFGFLALAVLMTLYLLTYASLTLFASAVARSQRAAAGLAIGLALVLGFAGAIPQFATYLPGSLVGWGAALALGKPVAPVWGAAGVSAGISILALVSAWLAFRRQEL